MALEARGFGASRERTSVADYRVKVGDGVALSVLSVLAVGATAARLFGFGTFG